MKKMKWVSLILVIVSISCSLFTPTTNKEGVVPGDLNQVFNELPLYDSEAPPPSPGAAALRALMVLDPGVAELQGDVEAAERAALNVVITDLSAKTGSSLELPFPVAQSEGAQVANLAPGFSVPAGYNIAGNFDGPPNTVHDVALIAGLTTGLSDIVTQHMEAGANVSGSATETKGDATATMSLEVGRSTDGSTKFGLGLQTETSKNNSSTSTDVAASVDGQRCPDAEGHVSFTVKVRLGADSAGAGYTQDLTAFVRAEVGDDARITSTTIDITQGTRQAKNGRQIYVETGETVKYDGDDVAGLVNSNVRMIRHSQDATQTDASALSEAGHEAAFAMARTALLVSEKNWLNGGCVKIEAISPGTVKPGSTTEIPVKVIHRFDGSAVPSKLEVALSGEKSIAPTSLAKTPGTLTYTAPDEKGKSATIKLTATSRRGRATLTLTASTGGQAYTVSAQSGPVTFSGQICSLDKPFVLNGTFANGSETQSFTPSNATSGTVEESGNSGGCTQSGGGSYTVTFNEQGSGELQWTETVTGSCPPYSATKTYTFNVPLIPAPDLSCP